MSRAASLTRTRLHQAVGVALGSISGVAFTSVWWRGVVLAVVIAAFVVGGGMAFSRITDALARNHVVLQEMVARQRRDTRTIADIAGSAGRSAPTSGPSETGSRGGRSRS
ncbi:hypothetical protein ET495_10550 [Xylanimonas allomyrinae]|uniref:Uncharacterized protein n=1 Tax=Xylanimonas allomyrinae TaxID=2509459 RepID=A0A4P6ETD0_9MICO|nr:hypothetical protein [Xylanimonas allomyrinae]QAY63617.1 hypothetical protein ET495_10550 [Xylanimonas allomyrinae]